MSLVRLLLHTSPRLLVVAAVAGLASGFSSAAMIALISRKLTDGGPVTTQFLTAFTGLLLLVVVLDLTAKQLLVRLAAQTNYDLGLWLTSRILATPLRTLEQTGAARLTAALTDDLAIIGTALAQSPIVLVNTAILIGCTVYLLWLSPLAFAVLAVFVVPAIVAQAYLHRKAKGSLRAAYDERDNLFRLYRLITDGFKDLKLHVSRRLAFWSELLVPAAAEYRKKLVAGRTYYSMSTTWGQTVFFLFVLGLFLLSAIAEPDVRVLTGYALVALYMRGSMNSLLSALPFWSNANLALERVESLGLSIEADAASHDDSFTAPIAVGMADAQEFGSEESLRITLRGVMHTYTTDEEDGSFTLGPINLDLKAGQLLFLTGANGSGKTTLVKLLTGLYLPEEGEILSNGVPLTPATAEKYRSNFSAVFADSYVFDQLLGISDNDLDTRAQSFLQLLQLENKVSIENGRLSTTDLSTGQRSRLSLMLAYLEDSPAYVFDEWAAGQDPAFKRLFYHTFLPELRDRGKLIVAITHDDHYYDIADRLVKLDSGQIEFDQTQTLEASEAGGSRLSTTVGIAP